jgi:apolipoprotein N-acyltransferase
VLPRGVVLLLAPLAGALITLSLAPFDIWPSAIIGCALYAYLLAACTPRQALWRGWLFGLGLFGSGASWVYVSIHVYGNASVGLAAAADRAVLRRPRAAARAAGLALRALRAAAARRHAAGLSALWVLGEWLRSWLLTGFPWLYLGYAHVDTWLAGWAPITGVYGLSFAVAFSASCLFLAWRSRQTATLVSYGGLLATLWGGGLLLQAHRVGGPGERTAAACGALPAEHPAGEKKWDRRYYRHPGPVRARSAASSHDLVLWPESAIPRVYDGARAISRSHRAPASLSDTTLITGIPTRDGGSLLQQHRCPGPGLAASTTSSAWCPSASTCRWRTGCAA